jgi:hypothetical protein
VIAQMLVLVLHLQVYTKTNSMIKLSYFLIVILLSCGASQKNTPAITETIDPAFATNEFKDSVPVCIRKKIDSFKVAQKHEQPQQVIQYEYKGKKVFYITMPCCDFFSELYDANCNLLGHPDGGFTGKGDGKLPDFAKEKTKEKIIWQVKQ